MKKEFQIKEPCNVGRENMKESSGGSFCDLCSKKVHDLSHKSDEEIKILLDTNESICGRIQVSRLYQQEEIAKTNYNFFHFPFRKLASGIFLAAMFSSGLNAQRLERDTLREQEIEGYIFFAPKRLDTDENDYYKSNMKQIKFSYDEDFNIIDLNILTLAKRYNDNSFDKTVNFPQDELGYKNVVVFEKERQDSDLGETLYYTLISKRQTKENAAIVIENAVKVEFKPRNKTLYFIDGELISKEEYESHKKDSNIISYFLPEIFAREILGNYYECEDGVILSYSK